MSLLRWAGSKRSIVGQLANYWFAALDDTVNARYVEAFAGSASLFFYIRPKYSVLVDINHELINCLSQIKRNPEVLHKELSSFISGSEKYYEVRDLNPSFMSPVERAVRFMYLNRNCFNGLYRTNRKGEFNVPYGGSKAGKIPSLEELTFHSKALAHAKLIHGDFESVVPRSLTKQTFVYLDPPYAETNRRIDQQYGPDVFGQRDLGRLIRLLHHIDESGAKFLLSYAESLDLPILPSTWQREFVTVRRTIAAHALRRRPVGEILISNL